MVGVPRPVFGGPLSRSHSNPSEQVLPHDCHRSIIIWGRAICCGCSGPHRAGPSNGPPPDKKEGAGGVKNKVKFGVKCGVKFGVKLPSLFIRWCLGGITPRHRTNGPAPYGACQGAKVKACSISVISITITAKRHHYHQH